MAEDKRADRHAHASVCAARLGQWDCKRCAQSKGHVSDVALLWLIHVVVRIPPRTRTTPTPQVEWDSAANTYTRRSGVNATARAPCFVQVLASTGRGSH